MLIILSLFPEHWYETLVTAYEQTSVGKALHHENRYEDWRLVSLRIVPCEPMGLAPGHHIETICWPELRLVWQPIQHQIRVRGRYREAYADDRAVHAIYPIIPDMALSAQDADRVHFFRQKIFDSLNNRDLATFSPLSPMELAEFVALRNQVSRKFLKDAIALRPVTTSSIRYSDHGLRPEFFGSEDEWSDFLKRLADFLSMHAEPQNLEKLTSFSLPAGRAPVTLDEWVFISFSNVNGTIQQQPITLHSFRDGRDLHATKLALSGRMAQDDRIFYDFWEGPARDWNDIRSSVILTVPDIRRLRGVLADRTQRLVPNTTCISCHKLNDQRFDFHNFSYLEDNEITVSPRVIRDVELDLLWIKTYL